MSIGEVYIQAQGHIAALDDLSLNPFSAALEAAAGDVAEFAEALTNVVEPVPGEHIASEVDYATNGLAYTFAGGNLIAQEAVGYAQAAQEAANQLPDLQRGVAKALEELQLALFALARGMTDTATSVAGCKEKAQQYLDNLIALNNL